MFDLLFAEERKSASVDLAEDMLFCELRDTVFAGQSELYDCFIGVISSPLTDRNSILKRQKIVGDFADSRNLLNSMCEVCREAKEVQTEIRKNLYQNIDAITRLKMNYQTVVKIFGYIDDFANLIGNCRFRSEDLKQVKAYFTQREKFAQLHAGLSELYQKILSFDYCSGEITFNEYAAFSTFTIDGFKPETGSGKSKKKGLFRKTNADDSDYVIDYSDKKDIERQIKHINEKAIYDTCRIMSGVYSHFKSLFRSLYEQLTFYRSALTYTEYYNKNDYAFCFPEIVCESGKIEAEGLYLLQVAIKNEKADANDFCTGEDSVFVVTGYNRGGKTTFLRSVGFAQICAQAGLAVPARRYKCSVFRYILSHFPRGEDKKLSAGLFEDEIKRLKNDIDCIDSHALVLMNESFSTTVETEAEHLASDVIAALSKTDSLIFFVTHFYQFAVNIDILNQRLDNAHAVNLVTYKYEKPNARTNYQIVRGDPIPDYRILLEDFI